MPLLFIQEWIPVEMIRALGWTFVHSLWQGLVAAGLAGMIILSTRRSGARLRYNLLGIVVITFLLTTFVTFYLQSSPTIASQKEPPLINETDLINTTILADIQAVDSSSGIINAFGNYFNTHINFFVGCWLVFFLVHCLKLLTGLAGIRRLRHRRTATVSEIWQTRMDELAALLHIRSSIRLLQSELVRVPVVIGFLKPIILVPAGLLAQLPADQVETILLHELAHIRRNDYLVNVLQRFIEAIFFFNPGLRWVSSLIRQEREACCDDVVVANTTSKVSYLEALVSFQEYALSSSAYAMAIGTNEHYLLNRVKRMLTRENKKLNLMEKFALLLGLTAVTAFSFIPRKEKDAAMVQQAPIVTIGKPAIAPKIPAFTSTATAKPKQPAKKERKKWVALAVAIIDTVPAAVQKASSDEVKFPNISSTVNHDGKTRTETTIATDQQGKKYNITKNDGNVTSLSIDGKNIPADEIKNYSRILDQIDGTLRERRIAREQANKERVKNSLFRKEESKVRLQQQEERLAKNREELLEGVNERTREMTLLQEKKLTLNQQARQERQAKIMERKSEEINRKIGSLSREKERIQLRIKTQTFRKLDIQRKMELRKMINQKLQLNKNTAFKYSEFKPAPVFKYDMQEKFDVNTEFKMTPKFDVKLEPYEQLAPDLKEPSKRASRPSNKPVKQQPAKGFQPYKKITVSVEPEVPIT